MIPNTAGRNFGLDLARSSAIMLVIISHFANIFEPLGFWGVELFFGLSGFLIGRILWRSYSSTERWGASQLWNFWLRRWYRTIPNYWLFLALTLLLLPRITQSTGGEGHLNTIYGLGPYLVFMQDFLSREGFSFGVSWSLCIEEWFYLTFPVVIFAISAFSNNKRLVFSIGLGAYILWSIAWRFWYSHHNPEANIRGITIARLDSISYGVLISFLHSWIIDKKRMTLILFTALGLLGSVTVGWMLYGSEMSYEQFKKNNVALTLAPLSLAFLLPALERIRIPESLALFKSTSFLTLAVTKISLWSYSMYLSHIMILLATYHYFGAFRADPIWNITSKFVALGLTIFVSAIIYKYFEQPLTRRRPADISGSIKAAS